MEMLYARTPVACYATAAGWLVCLSRKPRSLHPHSRVYLLSRLRRAKVLVHWRLRSSSGCSRVGETGIARLQPWLAEMWERVKNRQRRIHACILAYLQRPKVYILEVYINPVCTARQTYRKRA